MWAWGVAGRAGRSPVSRAPQTQPPPKHQPQPLSPKPVSHTGVLSDPTASRVPRTDPWVSEAQLHHTPEPHVLVWAEVS